MGTKISTISEHASSVFAVQLQDQSLISGSKDGTARMFDLR